MACAGPLEGIRVVVVDDEDGPRTLFRVVLELQGSQVTAVSSARDALDAMKREIPDVLVSDIMMPNEDGYWLIAAVAALRLTHGRPRALARFAAGRYDVVMTDLLMPDMSGLEVVEELRRIDPSVPMVLLTGAGGGSVSTDARAEGVLMIYKPVSLMKLKAALETRCQRAVGA